VDNILYRRLENSLVSIRLEFLCRDTNRYYRRRRSFAKFTAYLSPIVSDKNILYEIGDFNLNAAQVVSIFTIVLFSYINTGQN
jgi:hypothetical protein